MIKEAETRADVLLQKSQARLEDCSARSTACRPEAPRNRDLGRGDHQRAEEHARLRPRAGRPRPRRQGPCCMRPRQADSSAQRRAGPRPRRESAPERLIGVMVSAVAGARCSTSASIPARRAPRWPGMRDGALLVRLAAAPVDGAANEALIAAAGPRPRRAAPRRVASSPASAPRREAAAATRRRARRPPCRRAWRDAYADVIARRLS